MSPPDDTSNDFGLGDLFSDAPPPKPATQMPSLTPMKPAPAAISVEAPTPQMPSLPPRSPQGPPPPAAVEAPEPQMPSMAAASPAAPSKAPPPSEPGTMEDLDAPSPPPAPKPVAPPKEWTCKAGKVVFQDGESSYDLIILEEGKVEVIVGGERVAVLDKPGTIIGEISALLKEPRSAEVKALTACRFTIYKDFQSLMANDPDKLLAIAKTLAKRLWDMNHRIDKMYGVLHAAKVKEEIVDNVATTLGGKKPKPNQKTTLWSKLGF